MNLMVVRSSKYQVIFDIENFRDSPNWEATSLRAAVQRDHKVQISTSKAYRAKAKALKMILGDESRQFGKLRRYAIATLKSNPGSTVKIHVVNHVFMRIYICLAACKKGLLEGCRKLVGVDGCHLKSKFKGQLLCAVGVDANDNIYPVAYAVVEIENKEAWKWFIELLMNDIGTTRFKLTFMSDQQKGLVEVFKELMPGEDHRFCVRHLYNNFKNAGFKGGRLKDLMWNAARAYKLAEHNDHMESIKKVDVGAYEWLNKLDKKLWCRHAHNPELKCNMLLNNISESFNSYIKEARDKPIITMLEMIRRQLMKRFHVKRNGMISYNRSICPRMLQKLDLSKKGAMDCRVYIGGDMTFEVHHLFESSRIVNLRTNTCTCLKWQLTGIPCLHAVAAIFEDRGQPEDYVDQAFSKESFLKAYEFHIEPVPGEDDWPADDLDEILPPHVKVAPGRPKKKRHREEGETTSSGLVTRKGTKITCRTCHKGGHNARTCKAPSSPKRRIYKKK